MVIGTSSDRAFVSVCWSLVYPGLGQASQGRKLAAAWHAIDFSALVIGGLLYPAAQALWWGAALALGLYSVVDAYWHGRR